MIGKIRKVLLTLALVSCLFPTGAGIVIAGDQNSYGDEPTGPAPSSFVLPYLSDGAIWLVDTEGLPPRRITHSGRAWAPSLSPDRTHLAFWTLSPDADGDLQNDLEIWIINLEIYSPSSQPDAALLPAPALQAGAASWPDVAQHPAPPVYAGAAVYADAAPQQRLLATGPGPVSPPSWSPTDSNSPGSRATNWSWPTSTGTRRPLP